MALTVTDNALKAGLQLKAHAGNVKLRREVLDLNVGVLQNKAYFQGGLATACHDPLRALQQIINELAVLMDDSSRAVNLLFGDVAATDTQDTGRFR